MSAARIRVPRRVGLALALLSLLLAAPLSAQLPPGKWWKQPEVIRDLGLTKPQIEKLDSLFATVRPKLIDLTAEVQKIEIDLEMTIEHSPFDEKKAAAAADRLSDARCRVMRAEMSMMLGARAILTDEQFLLFRAREERMRPERPGPGRPGMGPDFGPGGRPPHGGPLRPDGGRPPEGAGRPVPGGG